MRVPTADFRFISHFVLIFSEVIQVDIIVGARYLLAGYRLILRPGLRRFFVLPVIVNILLFSAFISLAVGQFDALLSWVLPGGDEWWVSVVRALLWVVFVVASLVVLVFTFTLAANLIAAPFNGFLAEKVAVHLAGTKVRGGNSSAVAEIIPSFLNELRKLSYFIAWAAPILVLAVIPGLNVLFPFIWILFAARSLAQEYLSYPLENDGMKFKEARQRLSEKPMLVLGFGLAVMAATMIPVVNFLVMPAAVAGATALWAGEWKGEKRMNGH